MRKTWEDDWAVWFGVGRTRLQYGISDFMVFGAISRSFGCFHIDWSFLILPFINVSAILHCFYEMKVWGWGWKSRKAGWIPHRVSTETRVLGGRIQVISKQQFKARCDHKNTNFREYADILEKNRTWESNAQLGHVRKKKVSSLKMMATNVNRLFLLFLSLQFTSIISSDIIALWS